jgi:hypothetical protein
LYFLFFIFCFCVESINFFVSYPASPCTSLASGKATTGQNVYHHLILFVKLK